MRVTITIILSWTFLMVSFAQDSTKVISYDQFIRVVKDHHPIAYQANLKKDIADYQLQSSKGTLDPVLKGGFNSKDYGGKTYYNLLDAGLTVPTWVGADFEAGYTQSYGANVNEMDYTPANGLVYAGVKLPLGNGLFFDKRRAAILKGRLYQDIAASEQREMQNDLILEASIAYWNWFEYHHKFDAVQELIRVNEERLENVKKSANLGDKRLIDTLEATIQLQNMSSTLLDIKAGLNNSRAIVDTYLWSEGILPMQLGPNTIPTALTDYEVQSNDILQFEQMLADSAYLSHPSFAKSMSKLEVVEVEMRMKKENLKPKVNLKYNFLHEPLGGELIGFNPNDYKFGVDLEIPILLRSARGDLQAQKAMLEVSKADVEMKQQNLRAKIRMALNDYANNAEQIDVLGSIVLNYESLVQAERKLYRVGESSLMLVNYREIAYSNAQLKWIEKLSKAQISGYKIKYAFGTLGQN